MIYSLAIYHWHRPGDSTIQLSFYYTDADGKTRLRHHTPKKKSLARFMHMVWRHTALDGIWEMTPSPVGDTEHWNYNVRPVKPVTA